MSRYFPYMIPEDCDCFDLRDYEIAFYANAIVERDKSNVDKKNGVIFFINCFSLSGISV